MPCRLSQPQPCDIKPKTTLATAFGRLSNWLGWRNKSSTPRSAQVTVVCIYTLMRPRSPRTPAAGSLRLPKQCLFSFPSQPVIPPPWIRCGRWDIMRPRRPKHQHTKCSCLGRRCKRPPGDDVIRYRDPFDSSRALGISHVCVGGYDDAHPLPLDKPRVTPGR